MEKYVKTSQKNLFHNQEEGELFFFFLIGALHKRPTAALKRRASTGSLHVRRGAGSRRGALLWATLPPGLVVPGRGAEPGPGAAVVLWGCGEHDLEKSSLGQAMACPFLLALEVLWEIWQLHLTLL